MTWTLKRDPWFRTLIAAEGAPVVHNMGAIAHDSAAAFNGAVAAFDPKFAAVAELAVSVANFRGESSAEWFALKRARTAVGDDEWRVLLNHWGTRATIRADGGAGEVVCEVRKADESNIEAELGIIAKARGRADALLADHYEGLFATFAAGRGREFVTDRADADWVARRAPFTTSKDGEVIDRHGKRLAEALIAPNPVREVVRYRDGDPLNLARPNLATADISSPLVLHIRGDIAKRIDVAELEARLVREHA